MHISSWDRSDYDEQSFREGLNCTERIGRPSPLDHVYWARTPHRKRLLTFSHSGKCEVWLRGRRFASSSCEE